MSDPELSGTSAGSGHCQQTSLLGVVLAGGNSSRMGTDKALLPHVNDDNSGRARCSYLEHAIERLEPLVAGVAVSGRPWHGGDHVIGLPDAVAGLGPAMGVATALRYAAEHSLAGVLVTPVDMPDLHTEHLAMLIDAWRQTGELTCACFGEQRAEPLLAIYPRAALAGVEQVVASQRRSLSRWVNGAAARRVPLPPEAARNVNFPSDR